MQTPYEITQPTGIELQIFFFFSMSFPGNTEGKFTRRAYSATTQQESILGEVFVFEARIRLAACTLSGSTLALYNASVIHGVQGLRRCF